MDDAAKARTGEAICRRDLPITAGRKPRRFGLHYTTLHFQVKQGEHF
jgi:hypothetical protein